MTLYWPRTVLRSKTPMFAFTPMSIAGPISGDSISDVVEGDAGFWRCVLAGVYVHGAASVRTWTGLSAQLNGRSTPICVPACRGYQPLPTVVGAYTAVPHSDGSYFSDGTGYVGGTMKVTVNTALARRATSAAVTVAYGGTIEPGHKFSFNERLYEVRTATYVTSTTVNLTFRPPIRDAVAPGDALNFDDPVCKMRLKDDKQMDLPLDMANTAIKTVEFVEDLST